MKRQADPKEIQEDLEWGIQGYTRNPWKIREGQREINEKYREGYMYIEIRSGMYLGGSWSYDLGEIQDVSWKIQGRYRKINKYNTNIRDGNLKQDRRSVIGTVICEADTEKSGERYKEVRNERFIGESWRFEGDAGRSMEIRNGRSVWAPWSTGNSGMEGTKNSRKIHKRFCEIQGRYKKVGDSYRKIQDIYSRFGGDTGRSMKKQGNLKEIQEDLEWDIQEIEDIGRFGGGTGRSRGIQWIHEKSEGDTNFSMENTGKKIHEIRVGFTWEVHGATI
jgi:hypothetical protein